MTATDVRECALSTDGTGTHCDCWFNPRNGGDMGSGYCCYCDEGMPYCRQIEDDESHHCEWAACAGAW